MAPIPKRKSARAPQIDLLMKPAIGIGIALLAYQFFKGLNQEIPRLDLSDDTLLRQVFFGESIDGGKHNYVVLCQPETTEHTSSVFVDAHSQNSGLADFRLLDCEQTLSESGKTIAERFKLNLKQRPTMFVSGHVGPPKQIPQKHLKTGAMLVKAIKNLVEPKAVKIETTQDLRSKCLNVDHCALLLKGSKTVSSSVKQAVQNLLNDFPKVTFAAVDTSNLFVKNLEEYLPEYSNGVHRFVVFQKEFDQQKDRLKTTIAPLEKSVNFSNMKELVKSVVVSKTTKTTPIPILPVLKTRTKKLEEEERAKRQRKQSQQSGGGDTTTGGMFQGNDGSRDGRKAERERRREEHRKNNPDYKAKTPEEIQEMERQRRVRMEKEAEKWNMAPEDAPEEGVPVDEYMDIEEDEGSFVEDEGGDNEEDEDVLDLD